MDFRKLKYALAVAKDRSFTKAAERIHISQSAISEQVRLLEEEIGFSIFSRTSRGIHLTDRGRSFLHEAERVYMELLNLSDTARVLHGSGETFVLGIGSGLAHLIVPKALTNFSAEFPKVQLEVKISSTRRVYDQLLDERIDAGIAVEGEAEKLPAGLIQKPFLDSSMVLLLPEGHEHADQVQPVDFKKVASMPLIMNELSVGYGLIVQSMFDVAEIRPNIAGVVDNIDTMKVMVENGLGIAILPEACVDHGISGSAIHVKKLKSSSKFSFCLLRRQRSMTKSRETHYNFIAKSLNIHAKNS